MGVTVKTPFQPLDLYSSMGIHVQCQVPRMLAFFLFECLPHSSRRIKPGFPRCRRCRAKRLWKTPKDAEYRNWPTHLYTNIQRTLSGHEPCICVHPPIRQNVRQNAATSAGPDKRGQENPPRTDKTSTRFSERERDYSDSKITTSTVQIIHIEIPKLTAQVFLSFVMFLPYFPLPLSSSAGTYCRLRKRTGR